MGFTSALPSFFLASNKIAKIAKLPKRAPGRRQLDPWDPTRCNPFEQSDISNAFFSLGNSQIPEIERHGGDWQKLATLMKAQTVNSLSITCECRGGPPMSSNATNKSLNVCLDTSNRDFLAAWLVVEVVHLCGGTDLDAWAVKNWLFSVDKSSYPYRYRSLLTSEKELMCKGGTRSISNYLAGKFTIWDNVGGNLWPSTKDAQGNVTYLMPSLIDIGVTAWQHAC